MRIRPPLAALAAAALFAAGGLHAAEPAAQAPRAAEDARRLETARLIIEITHPYDQMVESNMVGWEAGTRKAMSLDPTAMALEKAHPGLGEAVVEAGRPTARTHLRGVVTEMLAYKTQVLVQRLTATELDEVLRFFRSDSGRRAVRGIYANVDPSRIGSLVAVKGASSGQSALTVEDTSKIEQAAAIGMMAQASAQDKAAILRFSRSAASRKFTAAGREAEVKLLEMSNNPDPQWLARQAEVMRAAAIAFMRRK